MRAKRYFYLLFLLLVCYSYSVEAQNIVVRSALDKNSIPIGAQTVLHVAAHMPAKSSILFPSIKDSIGKIKIVGSSKPDTLLDRNNPLTETVTLNYTITCFDEGAYTIPPFEFHTINGILKTEAIKLQIKPVLVDTTKVFYDIKQPFVVAYTFWDWLKDHWLLVLVIYAAIVSLIAMIFYLKNRPVEMMTKKTAPILTVDAIALTKLYALRDKKLWQQNQVKHYYVELTAILREYLEARYHIQANEQTSRDIIRALQDKNMPAALSHHLENLLSIADLVKFAREEPVGVENEQKIEDAIRFIQQTTEGVLA